MKAIRFVLILFLMATIFVGGGLFYGFKIEPYRIKVNEYYLNKKNINTEPLKIVQFSDLHIKEDFTYLNLQKAVTAINMQNPDIVIFTGDLYDNYAKYKDDENVIQELQKVKAKYVKIAVWGNRDYGGGAVRQYESIMEKAGFTLLKNENWYITVEHDKKILFTGLDDSILGNTFMPDSDNIYKSDYDILLSHEPDTMEVYRDCNYDLTLSGHSHGGQINIPFLPFINEKAVSATSLSAKYVGGMYTIDSNKNNKMYVNTGIGTTHISARFGVVPEISVFYVFL